MTAQRIEAAKPTKPQGSAEGESLVGRADAPNSLPQKDSRMTDTTEQQAVTVAQEAMYLIRKGGYFYRPNAQGYTSSKAEAGRYTLADAIAHSHPNGPDGPRDGMDYMLADGPGVPRAPTALRLASVSSASAETPGGTFACPICGKDTPHYHSPEEVARHRETEAWVEESWQQARPLFFPEPVPATNQAGEVIHGVTLRSFPNDSRHLVVDLEMGGRSVEVINAYFADGPVYHWASTNRQAPEVANCDDFAGIEEWEHDTQRELSRLFNHAPHDGPQFNRGQMREAICHGKRLATLATQPATSQEAIEAGKAVLEGRGDGTYAEAEQAIRGLIAHFEQPATSQEGEEENAASICDSDRCLAVFGAPEWAELSDDGKQWVVTLIKEAVVRLHKQEGKSHG